MLALSTTLFEALNSTNSNRFKLMTNPKPIKVLKLAAILFVAGFAFFVQSRKSSGATPIQSARLFEIAGIDMPLEKRVGVDDGAAFVVHFAGDTRGSLDSCG